MATGLINPKNFAGITFSGLTASRWAPVAGRGLTAYSDARISNGGKHVYSAVLNDFVSGQFALTAGGA